MTDELQDLKDDYRAIRAPDYLATRVRAHITEGRRSRGWLPGVAVAGIAAAVLVPLILMQQQPAERTNTGIPSLSQLAPEKPAVSLSSLGSLRSVSLPPMPAKPERPESPDSQTRIKDNPVKETDYEYV